MDPSEGKAMGIEIKFQDRDGYLFAAVTGEWSLDGVKALIDKARDELMSRNRGRLFADVRNLKMPESEFDRFRMGEYMAEILRAPVKMALLSRQEVITRFLENTAVNRGAWVKVFAEETEALGWLLQD